MQQIHGIGLKIGAIALFTVMFALVKALSDTIPAGQAVFFRSAFAIPVLFAWLMMQGELAGAVTVKSKRAHVWRGFVGTAAMGLNFTAAGFLPLPEITAIGFTTPLLIVVFASVMLGERVGVYRISAVLVGLIGVLTIVEPRLTFGEMDPTQDVMMLGVIWRSARPPVLHWRKFKSEKWFRWNAPRRSFSIFASRLVYFP